MNKKLNLVEILKDAPAGTKLYSPLLGEVEYERISAANRILVRKRDLSLLFLADGRYYDEDGECILFPSKEQRDWSKFSLPVISQRTKVTIHPLDPVLVRDGDDDLWVLTFYAKESGGKYFPIADAGWLRILPYTAETIPLVNTPNPCLVDYEIEFAPTPRVDVYK